MRFEGKLEQWNEERGFGAIEAAETRERLFVHISAFERGRVRPPLGTRLEFDVERDAKGRKRAVNVRLPAEAPTLARIGRARSMWLAGLVVVCALAVIGVRAGKHEGGPLISPSVSERLAPRDVFGNTPDTGRRCDGRKYCSQMHSCEEATWFLQHCAGTQMDGNGDGVPCEQQWCGTR
jgi:cold shock CspA family protein